MLTVKSEFDSTNQNWEAIPNYNMLFIRSQENYVNDLLIVNGYVFLNEVNDLLGLPRTVEGQLGGWIKENGRINFHPKEENDKISLTFYIQEAILQAI